jgi:sec-independent protein translocase protein TatB
MSMAHLVVIAVIALIVLGPEKMPHAARTAGKMLAELRRITGDFRATVEGEVREIERQTALKEVRANFPENAHYDVQQAQENTIAASHPAAVPAAESEPVHATAAAPAAAAAAETATASRKPSNGEPTPA